MKSYWRFWLQAKREETARQLLNRAFKRAPFLESQVSNIRIDPYPKINGFVASFDYKEDSPNWELHIYNTIKLGQELGYSWALSGSIDQQCDGFTHKTNISGIDAINWMSDRAHS